MLVVGDGPLWLLRGVRRLHHVIWWEFSLIESTIVIILRTQACHTFCVPSYWHVIDVRFAILMHPICHIYGSTRILIFALSGLAPIILFSLCLNLSASNISDLCTRKILHTEVNVGCFFDQRGPKLQLHLLKRFYLSSGLLKFLRRFSIHTQVFFYYLRWLFDSNILFNFFFLI